MLTRNEFHSIITEAERKLKEAGVASPQAEVELILEHLLDVDRLNVYLHGAELISEKILIRFQEIIERRTSRYPLQYILGEAWFYGRQFSVTPDVMVPTPETEILCDLAINYIKNEGINEPVIVDVGTGSGIIAITVAAEVPSATITAVDISRKALDVAERNARTHRVGGKIDFMISDCLAALAKDKKYDLILSNPPYISEKEYETLPPEVLADPKNSLVSGPDGLDFIKRLLDDAAEYLKNKGQLMFEIGYNQAEQVSQLSEEDNRYKSLTIIKDLNDIDRVVILSVD
jgi:release factor glutamine methyltransferase